MQNYDPDSCCVKLDFEPKWAFIGNIRGFIENFIFNCIRNHSLGKSVALTTSELLENAVKYSTTEKISFEIRFKTKPRPRASVILKISNKSDAEKIRVLQSIMENLYKTPPKEAYLKRMQEILLQDKSDSTSRLGLARIRHECKADLKLDIQAEQLVVITATIKADI